LILLAVLLPLVWLGWNAYVELHAIFAPGNDVVAAGEGAAVSKDVADAAAADIGAKERTAFIDNVTQAAKQLRDKFRQLTGIQIGDESVKEIVESGQRFLATKAISGLQSAVGVLIGLAIMVIGLYYFLADGPAMIDIVMDLSPLDARYEQELLERFGDVSRAVVVATLLSAVVQGMLALVGYSFALSHEAPVFLLTALTMVTALVPFVGAAAVWICVVGWVYLYGEHIVDGTLTHGDPTTAIILAIYCTIVVSGIDNVIKPFILHGQSKLHPLLALLSILGGVQVLGPVGILVGPMLVSFLQALLNMLRKELDSFGSPVVEGAKPLAESVAGAIQQVADDAGTQPAKAASDLSAPAAGKATPAASGRAAGRRAKRKK
jgi:predicted PurR-regulated permease PerM